MCAKWFGAVGSGVTRAIKEGEKGKTNHDRHVLEWFQGVKDSAVLSLYETGGKTYFINS